MKNYMDENFTVINDTILTYNGKYSTLIVPALFADNRISKIADAAFKDVNSLRNVILPSEVKAIGNKAFEGCDNLAKVVIPGSIMDFGIDVFSRCKTLNNITVCELKLTANEYHKFKNNAIRSDEDVYILHEMPKHKLINDIVLSINNAAAACKVPDGIPLLFRFYNYEEWRGELNLYKEVAVMGINAPSVPTSENDALFKLINGVEPEFYDKESENENDRCVRMECLPKPPKTIIFTFDDSKTKEDNGDFLIEAQLELGYFFWQSAQPVMYNNKRYYIYSRYYLSHNPKMKYARNDIAVYTDEGPVNNTEEEQKVYAKYKLLSIL